MGVSACRRFETPPSATLCLRQCAAGLRTVAAGFGAGLHGCVVLELLALRCALVAQPGTRLRRCRGSRTKARHHARRATRSAGRAKLQALCVVAVAVGEMLCAMVNVFSSPSLSVAMRNLTPLKPSKASCSFPLASEMETNSNGNVLVKNLSSRPRLFTVNPIAPTSRTAARTGSASVRSIVANAMRGRTKVFRVEPDHRRLEADRRGARGG